MAHALTNRQTRLRDSTSDHEGPVTTAASDPADRGSRRWWALGAVFLTVLCVGIDSTVLSVALPTLASPHASEPELQ